MEFRSTAAFSAMRAAVMSNGDESLSLCTFQVEYGTLGRDIRCGAVAAPDSPWCAEHVEDARSNHPHLALPAREYDLAPILREYITTAFEAVDEDTPPDGHKIVNLTPADLSDKTFAQMVTDVTSFAEQASDLDLLGDMPADDIGYDFWMTRADSGVGFLDRGLGERGKALDQIARYFREVSLVVGDDGKVYAE